jgi:hypothetical protein
MKIKVSEATNAQLDWLVAKCEGHAVVILSPSEQRERWLGTESGPARDRLAAEYEEHFKAQAKPLIRILSDDGYKRLPYHTEAIMPFGKGLPEFQYTTNWFQMGPIIERKRIGLSQFEGFPCQAYTGTPAEFRCSQFAPEGQPLIAAARCYVASELGDEVEVPEEL